MDDPSVYLGQARLGELATPGTSLCPPRRTRTIPAHGSYGEHFLTSLNDA
jgi:hypothetical protein